MANKKHANSVAGKVRAYMKAHPTARPSFVAKELGVNVQAVYTVRYDEKKRKQAKKKEVLKTVFKKLDAGANGTSVSDMVNHPPHYKVGGIETIFFIKAKLNKDEYIGYLRGNVLKYASRLGSKTNAAEDAGKMAWYSNELAKAMNTP